MGRQAEISLISSNNNASQSPEKREQFNLVNTSPATTSRWWLSASAISGGPETHKPSVYSRTQLKRRLIASWGD